MDDDRLKNLGGGGYFKELLETHSGYSFLGKSVLPAGA